VQQTEYGHVAERKVKDKQQGSIYPGRRAPRRKRVYAKCRRTSEEDLNPVAVQVTGWHHAALDRKNGTSTNGRESDG